MHTCTHKRAHTCLQVSVDIFKGFPDEDSIVNYTLNQAYQDNVSVFASKSHELSLSGLVVILFEFYFESNEILTPSPPLPLGVIFQTNRDGSLLV